MRPELKITGRGLPALMDIAEQRGVPVEVIIRGLCLSVGIGDAVIRVQDWVAGTTTWNQPGPPEGWRIEGPAL